ncbi:ABC transporter I family member 10 isoform X3 [Magnolia sinica]|uniref:ABC transporter I family member 10 isoform X3 n=1 Tax=Magnolia sinica TaxID=86752 RepID=UPI0026587203|nr:ABC transporter I family member 10 isoform X3 [Magnolia sinica]
MYSMTLPPPSHHLVGPLSYQMSFGRPPSVWISNNYCRAVYFLPQRKNCLFRCCSSNSNDNNMSFTIEGRNLSFSVTMRKRHLSGGQVEEVVPILNHCSIRIPTGQLWMLLGPNGCGKSTLLKVLAGLLSPTDGYVCIKRPKSFVFQNPDHQVVMPTVEADVAFGLGKFDLTPDEVRSRVKNALEAVGMSEYLRRPVQTLSGGQKQRVAIAGALAESCEVLLLDELTTFLDENDQVFISMKS